MPASIEILRAIPSIKLARQIMRSNNPAFQEIVLQILDKQILPVFCRSIPSGNLSPPQFQISTLYERIEEAALMGFRTWTKINVKTTVHLEPYSYYGERWPSTAIDSY